MKYLGIDYGSKRIGVAVSDEKGSIAFPRVAVQNDGGALERIADIAKAEGVTNLVIGDTRAFSGAENRITPEAESFARELAALTGIEVEASWEAWSSREASRFAPKDVKNDSAAAAIILQRFLDMRKS